MPCPVASRMPSGSSAPFPSALTTASQSLSISFSVTPSLSAVFMSPLKSRPTVSPSAKSLDGTTYVQPRAVGSSWISSFAAALSATSRERPPRENSVRYGPTPPTDRDQPHRSRICAGDFPRIEPSSP